jgi:magnesium transporter
VTVLLLPPSFIAGFFGMNFERLPLLHDAWGVSICLVLMIASSVLPFLYFKRRRWL